jgi:hypothetical protein
MAQFPPPYCLKAVELGLVDPEAVVPREWIYDLCVLCPASPEDFVSFLRQQGASSEVDDTTYLALVAAAHFRKTLAPTDVARLLAKRFSTHTIDAGIRGCLQQLASPGLTNERADSICSTVLAPYQELANRLLADLPAPDEFTCWR